ncbi:MAG TPA: VIT family protein [Caulobacteraceae bacterium]|jgi:VIT1/CCC1 family predicted Fe2+/Mn2+ transporter|nr:VIT family protein [Caulobacteraceae bacterium]
MARRHHEIHYVNRIGWLRAAVLGANDGIVSVGSIIVGVASASASQHQVLIAGVAGSVAGAMSMAAGEYISVSSQADSERADIERERRELAANPRFEQGELARIYIQRGLSADLAKQVAAQLTATDALASHARDELGITEVSTARPVQAALASAVSFSIGAAAPLIMALIAPRRLLVLAVVAASLIFLAVLGAVGARAGGANIAKATLRVAFWGALAMAVTAGIGHLLGATPG